MKTSTKASAKGDTAHVDNGADKRNRILEAAANLIAENGLQASPMSQIARSADVAMGTVYLYFASKQELVDEIFKQLMRELTGAVISNYSAHEPVRERFFKVWSANIDYMVKHPRQAKLLLYLNTTPFLNEELRTSEAAKLYRAHSELIREGKESGELKDVDPNIIVWSIYGSILFLVSKDRARQRILKDKTQVDKTIQVWWDGIRLASAP